MLYFFLSYARNDDTDAAVEAFFDRLCDEVRIRAGERDGPVGFMDSANLRAGDQWGRELVDALCTCRVLLAVASPSYSTSEACAAEAAIFRERLRRFEQREERRAPSLIPLVWLSGSVPPRLRHIQYEDREFGQAYNRVGLRQLIRLDQHRDDYLLFVEQLAKRIVDTADRFALPDLRPRPYDRGFARSAVTLARPGPDVVPMAVELGPATTATDSSPREGRSAAPEDPVGRIVTFYSYKGGVGRTMALANVAWILASNGKRVLVADWDLEAPGLHRYFRPFLADPLLRDTPGVLDALLDFAELGRSAQRSLELADIERAARVAPYVTAVERYPFPGPGRIDLMPAGRQDEAYSRRLATFNWNDFYDRLGGGIFFDAMARDLRRHYDFVLVDSRTGLTDGPGVCTVLLPDTVAVCFTLNLQSIEGAAAVASSIRHLSQDTIDLYPVPMRIEGGEAGALERVQSYARQRFESFMHRLPPHQVDGYWNEVRIPYDARYAYVEILAAFADRSRPDGSMLVAYERLTSRLVGEPMELVAPPERLRTRLLAEFEHPDREPVAVVHAPPDRAWAEWTAAQLRAVGQPSVLVDVNRLDGAPDRHRLLLLHSARLGRHAGAAGLWKWIERHRRSDLDLLVQCLDGTPPPVARTGDRGVPDCSLATAAQTRESLFRALDLPVPFMAAEDWDAYPRYPAERPPIWRAPARSEAFDGSDEIVLAIRSRLADRSTAHRRPVALLGPAGIGKTGFATEYAHRFAADYDAVWWIDGEEPATVRRALTDLARAMQVSGPDPVVAALDALRRGVPAPRWLIVLDGATTQQRLGTLIPTGGDVLVTTRRRTWADTATAMAVDPARVEPHRRSPAARTVELGPGDC